MTDCVHGAGVVKLARMMQKRARIHEKPSKTGPQVQNHESYEGYKARWLLKIVKNVKLAKPGSSKAGQRLIRCGFDTLFLPPELCNQVASTIH